MHAGKRAGCCAGNELHQRVLPTLYVQGVEWKAGLVEIYLFILFYYLLIL